MICLKHAAADFHAIHHCTIHKAGRDNDENDDIRHRLMKYLQKCATAIPAGAFSVDLSNQFIRGNQCLTPNVSSNYGQKFGQHCVQNRDKNGFGSFNFWPLVTLKVRSHEPKLNQFIRLCPIISTPSFIKLVWGPKYIQRVWKMIYDLLTLVT